MRQGMSAQLGAHLVVSDPDALIAQARDAYTPIATWCLFSGGHDSSVLAHRCRDHYQGLCFIDTGTAFPGVVDFVEEFAAWLGKPLRIMRAGDAFRKLVLELGGFPGPAGHGRAYARLKERQIRTLVRCEKAGQRRRSCVMLLTGKRRAESARRAASTLGIDKRGGHLFVNPLVDWTGDQVRAYRTEHDLPESDAAALLHRSGECNCGSFAKPGEREMLRALAPGWFDANIGSLEREANAAGIAACRWGERPPAVAPGAAGPLCSTCEWRATQSHSQAPVAFDLLDAIRDEIAARRDQLRPYAQEASMLHAALRALRGS
jgi:3'-phosphoadenosine 5'-phosphosulfate sulfotransferase (PAPS reductase)/FAD synthetase